jgi:putative sterol carrier protein
MGQALDKTVIELGKWGSQFLPETLDCVALPSLGTVALAIKAFFHPQAAQGIQETYELHLDDEVLQVQVDDGQLRVQQGQALKADAVFQTSMETFLGLFSGQLKPDDATAAGLVRVEGDPDALTRFLRLSSAAVSSDQTA